MKTFIFTAIWFSHAFSSQIHIVCTSALVEPYYESRKEEYIAVIELLKRYGYEPYLFEACHPGSPSFLEEHTTHVFYSNVNNYALHNKGVNEANSMILGLNHYRFDDNDLIIKITGRYRFQNREFLNTVENHPEIDIFAKCDPEFPTPHGKVFTGCFAMKYHLFKKMLKNIDLLRMEKWMIDIEREVANFIKEFRDQGGKVLYLDSVGIIANIGGSSPPTFSYW